MGTILLHAIVILCLLLANGAFAMAEISLVSARKARLQKLADDGKASAAKALALAQEPNRFLSTVQIGITLVGILAGAFGGANLSNKVAEAVARIPGLGSYSHAIGMAVVVGTITYASLIIGELVPKRIGLNNPERKAMLIAGPMTTLSRLATPFVWFLTASTNVVLKLLGIGREPETPPSDEEVSHLVEQGTTAGVFHRAERGMVEGVLRLDDRPITEIMTRRADLVFLDIADADAVNRRKIVESGHSHFPVVEGNSDHVLGMVSVKTLWAQTDAGEKLSLRDHLWAPLFVPRRTSIVQLLESFRQTGKQLALVTDEHGGMRGIVSLIDVMEAIVGELPEPDESHAPSAIQRDDGTWVVDGAMDLEEVERRFGIHVQREGPAGPETVGGFILNRFGHIPQVGEKFDSDGWRFEVVDMDRHRVDKVLLSKRPAGGEQR